MPFKANTVNLPDGKKEISYFLLTNLEELYAKVVYDPDLEHNKLTLEVLEYNNVFLHEDITKSFIKGIFHLILLLSLNTVKLINLPVNRAEWEECYELFNNVVDRKTNIQSGPLFKGDVFREVIFLIKRTRRNHYIPRGYLNNFCSNLNKTSKHKRIYVYDKEDQNLMEKDGTNLLKITNIAFKDHFYSMRFELFLAHTIEPGYFKLASLILEARACNFLMEIDKIAMLRFLFSLYLRTVDSWEHHKELTEGFYKSFYSELCIQNGINMNPSELTINVKDLKLRMNLEEFIIKFIQGTDSIFLLIFHKFINMEWGILNSHKTVLFTSDHPVILFNKHNHERLTQSELRGFIKSTSIFRRGFLDEGIHLYFPLTPELCLYIVPNSDISDLLTPIEINTEIVKQAYLYLFLSVDNREFITNIIKEFPETVNKDGNRIKVEKL